MSIPNILSNDFFMEVVQGNADGFVAKNLMGLNAAVGGTEDVWNQGGSITQVATAALLYISSSAAADTSFKVTITGLDEFYNEITEVITTNSSSGRTQVAGTKAFLRVNSATITSAAAGKIYVYYYVTATNGVPDNLAKVQAAIDIAALCAYNAIYTVPVNKNLYLTSLRLRSTGSTTTNDVIVSVLRKLYGGTVETLETVKYLDLGTTLYTDKQVMFKDHYLFFPAKSEFRITAGLSGGTALNITVEPKCVEETFDTTTSIVTLLDKVAYAAYLTGAGRTIASQNYWLIGLDEYPTELPQTADLSNVLATITGTTSYKVAADTEVTFDYAYYVSGKLINTTKKAVLTIMRCVDNASVVKYVLATDQVLINIRNVKKIKYLA